jgi:hypothetical protein
MGTGVKGEVVSCRILRQEEFEHGELRVGTYGGDVADDGELAVRRLEGLHVDLGRCQ